MLIHSSMKLVRSLHNSKSLFRPKTLFVVDRCITGDRDSNPYPKSCQEKVQHLVSTYIHTQLQTNDKQLLFGTNSLLKKINNNTPLLRKDATKYSVSKRNLKELVLTKKKMLSSMILTYFFFTDYSSVNI